MTTKRVSFTVLIGALITFYLPTQQLRAQAVSENRYSTPIDMVVNAGTSGERWATSHFGVMEPIGLRQNERTAITLIVPSSHANYPVGLAPLDGGEILAAENLYVGNDGTVSFEFVGGIVPGLYRVLVSIRSEQYQLRIYVAKPSSLDANCQPL